MMKTYGVGQRVLGDRYALLECLAISGVGDVYRGRDLELASEQGADSRVLLHLLPAAIETSIELSETLAALFAQMQTACHKAKKPWILMPRAFGVDEGSAYIVLDCPPEWGLHSLLSLSGGNSIPQEMLKTKLSAMAYHKQLAQQIDGALLLRDMSGENLYLLGTALSRELQNLQNPCTSLTIPTRKQSRFWGAGAATTVITLSTLASTPLNSPSVLIPDVPAMESSPATKPAEKATTPKQLPTLTRPAFTQQSRDLPVQVSALPVQVSVPTEPVSAPTEPEPPAKVAQQTVSKSPAKKSTKKSEKPTKSAKPAKPTKSAQPDRRATQQPEVIPPDNLQIAALIPAVQEQNHQVVTVNPLEPVSIPSLAPVQLPDNTAVQQAQAQQPAPLPVLNSKQIIQQANIALQAHNLGNNSPGALYYARELKKRKHLHPQVKRISRAIILRHHQKSRQLMKAGQILPAKNVLETTRQIIVEFNLVSLNPAQRLLEEQAARYQ